MRKAWILVAAAVLSLAGCTTPEGEPVSDQTLTTPVTTTTTTSSPPAETTTTSPPTPVAENHAPTAALEASAEWGQVPFNVTFDMDGGDADGDALQWTLDVDGDAEAEATGTSLPASFTYTFDVAGNWTATLHVSDGDEASVARVAIVAEAAASVLAQSFFFTPDLDAETCTAGFLVADLAATQPEDGFCNGAPVNAVLTEAGLGLVEVAVAQTPAAAFPAGTAMEGAVYVTGTAGSPVAGSLNVSIEKDDGTVLAAGVHEVVPEGPGTVAVPFTYSAAADVLDGDILVLKVNFSGASAGYTFGTGEASPTGFTLGGAHPAPSAS